MSYRVQTSFHCLAVNVPLSRPARIGYRGLARRTLFDLLGICEMDGINPDTLSESAHGRIWEAWRNADEHGFELIGLPEDNGLLIEVKQFIGSVRWTKIPEAWRWHFELVLSTDGNLKEFSPQVLQVCRAACESFPVMSGTVLEWLGFDLIEQDSTWSALANIMDWQGPQELLNEHGLCETYEDIAKLRDVYLRADDPDRASPEEYLVRGLARTSLLDG